MYGMIGQFKAKPGQRAALVDILMENVEGMPGCVSYIVALDPQDADSIWITEVWRDEASHKASLDLPSVKDAIARAMPMLAGFGMHQTTQPVGGTGFAAR